jgi:hypothetical protein
MPIRVAEWITPVGRPSGCTTTRRGLRLGYRQPSHFASGPAVAKPNYAFEKRQRELEKKRKKEEKAQRKSSGASPQDGAAPADDAPPPAPAPAP